MANVQEVFEKINEVYPVKISDDYCSLSGHYDNSGIIIDNGNEVKKVLFSLDFSIDAIDFAIEKGYDLIVTHHPAIFLNGPTRILYSNPLGKRLLKAIQNGINVISMHLNLDLATNGIDEFLMKAVGGNECIVMDRVENGAYGRVYQIDEKKIGELSSTVKTKLQTEKCFVYNEEVKVKKVASFCGAGVDDESIKFAKEQGANVVISADMKHHNILDILQEGMGIIQFTHYATENYGFKHAYNILKDIIGVDSFFYIDDKML